MDGVADWVRARRLAAAGVAAAIGGVVAYVANVWLMAVRYEGYQVPVGSLVSSGPAGSPVAFVSQLLQGTLSWLLIGAIAAAVATHVLLVGPPAAVHQAAGLPRRLWAIATASGPRWQITALVGGGVALVVVGVLLPALRLPIAVGVLLFLPSAFGQIMTRSSAGLVAVLPFLDRPVPAARIETWMLGAAAGCVLAWILPLGWLRGLAGVALISVALVLSHRGVAGPAAMVLCAVVIVRILLADGAGADDGGWSECRDVPGSWFSCPGSGRVLATAVPGAAAAAAGAAGGALGATASFASSFLVAGPGPAPDGGMPKQDTAEPDRDEPLAQVSVVPRHPVTSHVDLAAGPPDESEQWTVRIGAHGDRGTYIVEVVDR